MIARLWRGETASTHFDEYLRFLERTGIPDYRATPGNLGVQVLRRIDGDRAVFLLISYWESFDAIKRFAGDDVEQAVFYPEDDDYLLERGPRVEHFEVATVFQPTS